MFNGRDRPIMLPDSDTRPQLKVSESGMSFTGFDCLPPQPPGFRGYIYNGMASVSTPSNVVTVQVGIPYLSSLTESVL